MDAKPQSLLLEYIKENSWVKILQAYLGAYGLVKVRFDLVVLNNHVTPTISFILCIEFVLVVLQESNKSRGRMNLYVSYESNLLTNSNTFFMINEIS